MTAEPAPLLEIDGLSVSFATEERRFTVVENVSFRVASGETLGVVGESGCGKSVTALSIMRLNPEPPSRVEAGRIKFRGDDLLALRAREMRHIRGNQIGMIFQEPMTSLNPTYTIGFQLMEVLRLHRSMSRSQAKHEAIDLLELVGVGGAARRLKQYAHELSGGLRQRVMIAIALACRPALLIADEPTTALDVTIQAQILDLLGRLQKQLGMSVILITHDLGVVAEVCDTVVVMYAGRIVEYAPVGVVFTNPRHPYTRGLLASSPRLGTRTKWLPTIPGTVPGPGRYPPGCAFADRCNNTIERCRVETPNLVAHGPGHEAACWNPLS